VSAESGCTRVVGVRPQSSPTREELLVSHNPILQKSKLRSSQTAGTFRNEGPGHPCSRTQKNCLQWNSFTFSSLNLEQTCWPEVCPNVKPVYIVGLSGNQASPSSHRQMSSFSKTARSHKEGLVPGSSMLAGASPGLLEKPVHLATWLLSLHRTMEGNYLLQPEWASLG
jgi:hypothetical protein